MEDAAARRARLKAMREAAEAEGQAAQVPADTAPLAQPTDAAAAPEEPVIKFRNYAPRDEKIVHEKVRFLAISNERNHPILTVTPSTFQVEAAKAPEFEEVEVDLDAVIGHAAEEVIVNVAPKKANWDLRRDIAPKLAKLERRTQIAMIELMREEEAKRAAGDADAA